MEVAAKTIEMKPEFDNDYQETVQSILKRTNDFVNSDFSENIIEDLAQTLKLIALEGHQWLDAKEIYNQIYLIGSILEFMKKSKHDFKNLEFYKKDEQKQC